MPDQRRRARTTEAAREADLRLRWEAGEFDVPVPLALWLLVAARNVVLLAARRYKNEDHHRAVVNNPREFYERRRVATTLLLCSPGFAAALVYLKMGGVF